MEILEPLKAEDGKSNVSEEQPLAEEGSDSKKGA